MNPETQKELLRLAKRAMIFLSVCKDRDFVFELRDVIRKADLEMGDDERKLEIH